MIAFLIYALIVCLVAFVIIYICDLLVSMLPSPPAAIGGIIRIIVILVALLLILQKGLPLIGQSLKII